MKETYFVTITGLDFYYGKKPFEKPFDKPQGQGRFEKSDRPFGKDGFEKSDRPFNKDGFSKDGFKKDGFNKNDKGGFNKGFDKSFDKDGGERRYNVTPKQKKPESKSWKQKKKP